MNIKALLDLQVGLIAAFVPLTIWWPPCGCCRSRRSCNLPIVPLHTVALSRSMCKQISARRLELHVES